MKKEGGILIFVVFASVLLTTGFVSASFFDNLGKWLNNPVENQHGSGELYSGPSENQVVAYYPFDGNANDLTGNGNPGIISGAVLTLGKSGNAYNFNGVNDYIDAGSKESLKPKKVTISAWIKTSGTDKSNRTDIERFIAGFGNLDYSNPQGYWIGMNRYGNLMIYIGTTSNYNYMTVSNKINDNQWHHITGTYDGILTKIYIDSILAGSSDGANGDITYTGLNSFKIGKIDSSIIPIGNWAGVIDEVKVWNYALTENEVKTDYDRTPCTPNCAGKQCGSDGCVGSCGDCASGQKCDSNAQCVDLICTDSDGGLDYYMKGTTSGYDKPTGKYVTVNDSCQYSSLKEYTCEGIYGKENEYACPNGCSDGACIQQPKCTDSDGGLDYYMKGTTSGYDKPTGKYVTVNDSCQYSSLKEYTCEGIYGKENEYACPNGCSDGKCLVPESEVCVDFINRIKNPTDFVEEGREYKLEYNSVSPGTIWFYGEEKTGMNYYASWNFYDNEISEYLSYQIFVANDKNINLNKYLEKTKENPYCRANDYLQGENQRVYICNWDVMEDIENNNGKSLQILWAKNNILIEAYISHWKGGDLNDEQISKIINQKTLSVIRNLENNEFKWIGSDNFEIDYPIKYQIEKSLSECKSDISMNECSPCWSCKIEPVICPPHGYQNKVCIDRCCDNPPRTEEQECSPGICSGCYVPRWYGWDTGNNVCIPYGTRFAQTKTEGRGEIPEGYNEGHDSTMNLTIFNNEQAHFFFKIEGYDKIIFDYDIWVGNEYKIDLTEFNQPLKEIRFRVDKIIPSTETENGYVSITVLENFNAYCDYTGRIEKQKTRISGGDWAKCQNNYECESNFCSSGECIEITQMISKAKGFKAILIKIVCKLANMFNVEEYEQCVARSIA